MNINLKQQFEQNDEKITSEIKVLQNDIQSLKQLKLEN